jgi:transposase, IS30 family
MKKTTNKAQMTYSHLSQNERDRIELLRGQGYSIRKIALVLNRDHSSLSRELQKYSRVICRGKKNGEGRIVGEYDSNVASHKSYTKRKYAKFEWKKINADPVVLEYVTSRLEMGWSPSDIGSRSKYELAKHISKTAIYEWMRSDSRGQPYCKYLYSGRKKVKKRKKNKTKREMIPNRVGIEMRPKYIAKRKKCGHKEADLIVSGRKEPGSSKEALSVMIDRKGKYLNLKKIKRATAELFNRSIYEANKKLTRIDSMTLDNGKENSKWQEMNIEQVYFCAPYHPWEKGSVENANLWLRRYFKKGSDLSKYSDEYVQYIETLFNFKPRKSLGGLTPFEVMLNEDMLVGIKKESLETHYLQNGILNSEYFKQQLTNLAKCASGALQG